jgi:hypothetical protein
MKSEVKHGPGWKSRIGLSLNGTLEYRPVEKLERRDDSIFLDYDC